MRISNLLLCLLCAVAAHAQVGALRGRSAISGQSNALAVNTLSPLPGGKLGIAYSLSLAASGGATPYSWTVTAGTLCTGLSLSSGGLLSGTPTVNQTCSFTAQVTDSLSATDSKPFSLTISPSGSLMGGNAKAGGSSIAH